MITFLVSTSHLYDHSQLEWIDAMPGYVLCPLTLVVLSILCAFCLACESQFKADKFYFTWLPFNLGKIVMHTTKGRHWFSVRCHYLIIEQILMRGMDQLKKRLRCLIRQRGEWKTFCPGQSWVPMILQAHLMYRWGNLCLAHPHQLLNNQQILIKKSSALSLGICRIQGRYCQWMQLPPLPSPSFNYLYNLWVFL